MNDEQFFLANAYLDGELTDDERAIAEFDPEVMAAVGELRALQDLVRRVDPPGDDARRAAISAAMSEFTAGTASAGRPPAPAPIPFRPRPSYAKYLAVAAGVLGVGLFGVAVANLDTGGDDDAADGAAEEPAMEPASEPDDGRILEGADAFEDDGGAEDEVLSEATADEPAELEDDPAVASAEEPAAEVPAEEPAEEPAAEPAAEPAEEPASGDSVRPTLVSGQVLTTPEELGSYGTGLLEQARAGTLPPSPNHACPIDNVLGRAEYLVGDTVTPVLVAVDEPADLVLAFTEPSCDPVAYGPLYGP